MNVVLQNVTPLFDNLTYRNMAEFANITFDLFAEH